MTICPNRFIHGDCLDAMKSMDSNSINLIVTSPPYADQRNYGENSGRIAPDQYLDWFTPIAEQIYRVLKPDGSFILNINDKVVGPYQHLYVFRLLIKLCDDIGFHLARDYVWYNPATPPNVFSRGGMGRTKKSHEYCFWLVKTDSWHFDLDAIRKPYGRDMQKYLDGKGKGARDANTRPSTHNFNCGKIWTNHGGSDPGSVIEIANTSSNDAFTRLCKAHGIKHPARFPEKLVDFFILAGSREGDVVMDPFGGSGTTIVSAAKLKRQWIYIDANPEYIAMAKERLQIETTKENMEEF